MKVKEERKEIMNRTNFKERGISILVSLLFHACIFFLLIKMVPPVRIFLYRQVAEVRILSPATIYLPRITGSSESIRPSELPVREKENLQPMEPEAGIVYVQNLNIGGEGEKNKDEQAFLGKVPHFDLIPVSKSQGGFSLGIEPKKSESDDSIKKNVRKDLNFSLYNSQTLSSLRFNRIMTHKGEKVPSGRLDQNVSSPLEGFDISPWVKEVVDKIRNNWILTPIDESIAVGEVKIFIMIGKQGNLMAMEMVKSSDFLAFDQTTTRAIRSTVPFPPLPDDFPSDRLEAYLVFQFYE